MINIVFKVTIILIQKGVPARLRAPINTKNVTKRNTTINTHIVLFQTIIQNIKQLFYSF